MGKRPIIAPNQRRLVQNGERMKVATVSIAGERRVGRVTDDGRSIAPYLKNGDVVRIEIGGIGVLENEIVERSA